MPRVNIFLTIAVLMISSTVSAQKSVGGDSSIHSSKYYVGFESQFGWSSNYGMKYDQYSYERNSPALIISVGPYFSYGSNLCARLGLSYTSIMFWNSDVDSAFYSSTGLETYRDARYIRSYTSLDFGILGRINFDKFHLVPGISIHRPFFPAHYVKDYIDNTKGQLYINGKGKGFNFDISLGLARQISSKSNLTLSYSLFSVNDRTQNPDVVYTSYPDVTYWGTFHSVQLSFALSI